MTVMSHKIWRTKKKVLDQRTLYNMDIVIRRVCRQTLARVRVSQI